MSSLTEFLLARIAEDEQAARYFDRGTDVTGEPLADWWFAHETAARFTVSSSPTDPERNLIIEAPKVAGLGLQLVEFIARFDPSRVLAECAAKRDVIDAAWSDQERIEGEWGHGQSRDQMSAKNDNPDALVALAAVFSLHPDFDPSWGVTP